MRKCRMILGQCHIDDRGKLRHNNDFQMDNVKRMYTIENIDVDFRRGWKGHYIESRWFTCSRGAVEIWTTTIENLEKRKNNIVKYLLKADSLDVLEVPPGFATLVKQRLAKSIVTVYADYAINTSNDENYRWPNDYIRL